MINISFIFWLFFGTGYAIELTPTAFRMLSTLKLPDIIIAVVAGGGGVAVDGTYYIA